MKIKIQKIALVLLFSAAYISLNAQQERGKLFLSVLGGYTGASGNFTKTEYMDAAAGYAAKSGFNIQLHSGFYVSKKFAIGLVVGSRIFQTTGLQSLSDGYLKDFGVDSATVTVSGDYINMNYLVGPTYTFPLGKLSVDVHALVGLSTLRIPKMKVDLENNLAATFYQNASSGSGLGIQAGIGARYFFSEKVGVELRVDYLTASPNVIIQNENRTNTEGRLLNSYKQQIGGIGASLGLSIAL